MCEYVSLSAKFAHLETNNVYEQLPAKNRPFIQRQSELD